MAIRASCTCAPKTLWRGRSAHVISSFPGVPTADELVQVGRDGGLHATLALSSNRKTMDTEREFETLKTLLLQTPTEVKA